MKEFLTKKYAGLPGWAWLLIGAAGIGAGVLLIRWQQGKTGAASLTATTTPDLTTGNQSGDESNPATGTVGSNGVIDNPFPETNVNGQQVPIIPPGYQAVYDQNGNIVGYEPIPPTSTPIPPPTSTPTPTGPGRLPGQTFSGPSGVLHYVTTGSETLSQIAQKFGLQSWNSVYAIPDNQKLFGKLDSKQAASYTPKANQTITLPAGSSAAPPVVLPLARRRAA